MSTILIFVESYRFSRPISDVKILANNDFNKVPDKTKDVSPTATLIYLITGCKMFVHCLLEKRYFSLQTMDKSCKSENLSVIHSKWIPSAKKSCGCRNSSDYTNFWLLLKPIESRRIVCMKLK